MIPIYLWNIHNLTASDVNPHYVILYSLISGKVTSLAFSNVHPEACDVFWTGEDVIGSIYEAIECKGVGAFEGCYNKFLRALVIKLLVFGYWVF